jgi:putative NADH-flavin reductase
MFLVLYETLKIRYQKQAAGTRERPDMTDRRMKLTIFGATGGIGRHLVDQAIAAGHDVTAVARNPASLPAEVRAVGADLATAQPTALVTAVGGADAVLSALGPRSKAEYGIASTGTRAIAGAMQAAGVGRLIVVSAAPVGTIASPGRPQPPRYDPGDGFVVRHLLSPLITAALRGLYVDLALMEHTLADSGLDWTVVRPPKLTNRAGTGAYRTAYGHNVRRGLTVSRADVAHLMLAVLAQPDTIRQTVAIAN